MTPSGLPCTAAVFVPRHFPSHWLVTPCGMPSRSLGRQSPELFGSRALPPSVSKHSDTAGSRPCACAPLAGAGRESVSPFSPISILAERDGYRRPLRGTRTVFECVMLVGYFFYELEIPPYLGVGRSEKTAHIQSSREIFCAFHPKSNFCACSSLILYPSAFAFDRLRYHAQGTTRRCERHGRARPGRKVSSGGTPARCLDCAAGD